MIFSEIDPLLRELLDQICHCGEPRGRPEVRARFFPSPTGGKESEFDEEWAELISGDLQKGFESARHLVQRDLETITSEAEGDLLKVSMEHAPVWVSALNQARLAIAARHEFTEQDLDADPHDHPQALSLFQMHFYGLLQERFLQEMKG